MSVSLESWQSSSDSTWQSLRQHHSPQSVPVLRLWIQYRAPPPGPPSSTDRHLHPSPCRLQMHRRQTSRVTNDQLGTQEMVCGRLHRPRQNPTCVTDLTMARPKLSRRQPRWREVDTSLQPSDKQPRQSCERRSRFVLHDFPAQPLFRRLTLSVSRHLVKKTTFRRVLGRQRPLHRPQSDISYRKIPASTPSGLFTNRAAQAHRVHTLYSAAPSFPSPEHRFCDVTESEVNPELQIHTYPQHHLATSNCAVALPSR